MSVVDQWALWIRRFDGNTFREGVKIEHCLFGIKIFDSVFPDVIIINSDGVSRVTPKTQTGKVLIKGTNTDNTEDTWTINDLGDCSYRIGYFDEVNIGDGNFNLKKYDRYWVENYSFPQVGVDLTVDIPFTEMIPDYVDNPQSTITVNLVGNVPANLVWTVFHKDDEAYLRLANTSQTGNTPSFTANVLISVFTVND